MSRIPYLVTLALRRLRQENLAKFSCRLIRFLILEYAEHRMRFALFIRRRKRGNFLLKQVQGSKMYLDMEDKGISRELAFLDIREPFSTQVIQNEIKRGDIVIDIGANIGYYALMEARLVGPEGKVYAVEPVPQNIEMLERNIQLNRYSNIETFPLAIGDENKISPMYISERCNWCSLVLSDTAAPTLTGEIDVNVVTLDDFLRDKKYPNFVRMDVEGCEYQVIRGMEKTLKSKRSLKLFIELHPHCMTEEQTSFILLTLRTSGFEAKKVLRELPTTLMHSSSMRRMVEFLSRQLNHRIAKFGDLKLTLDDMLNDKSMIEERTGGLSILFERS